MPSTCGFRSVEKRLDTSTRFLIFRGRTQSMPAIQVMHTVLKAFHSPTALAALRAYRGLRRLNAPRMVQIAEPPGIASMKVCCDADC